MNTKYPNYPDYPDPNDPKALETWLRFAWKKTGEIENTVKWLNAKKAELDKKYKEHNSNNPYVFGYLFAGGLLLFLYVAISIFCFFYFDDNNPEPSILFNKIIWLVIFLILGFSIGKHDWKFYIAEKKKLDDESDNMHTVYENLQNGDHKEFYDFIFPFLGPSYCNHYSIDYIIRLLMDGRASNLQDAKNLFEQDKALNNIKVQQQNYENTIASLQSQVAAARAQAAFNNGKK